LRTLAAANTCLPIGVLFGKYLIPGEAGETPRYGVFLGGLTQTLLRIRW
jgi:hypothetical protein